MTRLCILGSCVTGDSAYLAPDEMQLVLYHSRHSFISLNSPPLALDDDALPWSSKYAKKEILGEFRKTVLAETARAEADLIVFDFMDERLDLLRCGDSYVVAFDELFDSGFPGNLPYKFERISRHCPEVTQLWEMSSIAVAAQLRESAPQARFALHRAWMAECYENGSETLPFHDAELGYVARMNALLAEYYAHFEKIFPGLEVIEIDRPRIADAQHRWGLAPYHYKPEYYVELNARMRAAAARPR